MARAKNIEFNGYKFRLSGRYYRRNVWSSPGPSNLHRAVWEKAYGPVPDGFHIHHKDGDSFNDALDNLECVPAWKHMSEHARSPESWSNSEGNRQHLERVREKSVDWHRSDAGREWHRRHGELAYGSRLFGACQCEQCGSAYETRHRGKNRYCSRKCSAKHRRDCGIDDEGRVCVVCGGAFSVNRYSPTRTCSKDCASGLRHGGTRV